MNSYGCRPLAWEECLMVSIVRESGSNFMPREWGMWKTPWPKRRQDPGQGHWRRRANGVSSRLFRPASCDLAGRLAKGALVFASMREELMDNCLPVMQGDVMNVWPLWTCLRRLGLLLWLWSPNVFAVHIVCVPISPESPQSLREAVYPQSLLFNK